MVLPLFFAVAILAFLPCTHALSCGDGSFPEVCDPDYDQTAYCCGIDDDVCCYYTNVVVLWWFWLALFFGIVITIICIRACCIYSRGRSRAGYIVVQGRANQPTATVIQSNQVTQAASAPVYPHSYQGYDPRVYTGAPQPSHGVPPPYAPPQQQPPYYTPPPQQQQPPPQKQPNLY